VVKLDSQQARTHDDVRRILGAAADAIFSDGVSDAFLDHWTDETMLLLSIRERSIERHVSLDANHDAPTSDGMQNPSSRSAFDGPASMV
jgi:hypothetical protein